MVTSPEKEQEETETPREVEVEVEVENENENDVAKRDRPESSDNTTTADKRPKVEDFGDEDFQSWILQQLVEEAPQLNLHEEYACILKKASVCITKWRQRYRGNAPLWNRLFKRDRVIKEVVEAVPIIHAVEVWIMQEERENVTIIDLCSGKGYLSMLLSEYLPPHKVQKFILVDKAWPLCHSQPKPHHISWEHIYGDTSDEHGPKYYETWPIPLVTSKQDLKQTCTLKQFQKRFPNNEDAGEILILAVHLCGTLSIQAIQLFEVYLPQAKALILKPCCLPGLFHAHTKDCFDIGGGVYQFPTKEVCASGKWTSKNKNKGRWKGPPRWHLADKFGKWCHHLHQGIDSFPQTHARLLEIPVQTKGGYQNKFLFSEKEPIAQSMWDATEQIVKAIEQIAENTTKDEADKDEGTNEES